MKKYIPPKIKKIITLRPIDVLSGSVVEKAQVKSAGQEVETYDFVEPEFNHDWE